MVYRCYIETIKNEDSIAWSYAFYNHQDFMVYKRFGKAEHTDESTAILQISATALAYFEKSMRRRYYDEHFSTRIDEDYVTLFTSNKEIPEVAEKIKSGFPLNETVKEKLNLWEALLPFLEQRTMDFSISSTNQFTAKGKELALNALK